MTGFVLFVVFSQIFPVWTQLRPLCPSPQSRQVLSSSAQWQKAAAGNSRERCRAEFWKWEFSFELFKHCKSDKKTLCCPGILVVGLNCRLSWSWLAFTPFCLPTTNIQFGEVLFWSLAVKSGWSQLYSCFLFYCKCLGWYTFWAGGLQNPVLNRTQQKSCPSSLGLVDVPVRELDSPNRQAGWTFSWLVWPIDWSLS